MPKQQRKPLGLAGRMMKAHPEAAEKRGAIEVDLTEDIGSMLEEGVDSLVVEVRQPTLSHVQRIFGEQFKPGQEMGASPVIADVLVDCSFYDGEPFFGSRKEALDLGEVAPTAYYKLATAVHEWTKRMNTAVEETKNAWRATGSSDTPTSSPTESDAL